MEERKKKEEIPVPNEVTINLSIFDRLPRPLGVIIKTVIYIAGLFLSGIGTASACNYLFF